MKTKTHFTRKNLIFLALLFFFFVLQTFCLLCLDSGSGIIKKGNPIALLAATFGIMTYEFKVIDYVSYFLVVFWTFICAAAILFVARVSKFYDGKAITGKSIIGYIVLPVICFNLSFSLSFILQYPFNFLLPIRTNLPSLNS